MELFKSVSSFIYHTRNDMTRRLPAEWEPQDAIMLTWPNKDTDWNYILDDATRCYTQIAAEISKRERLIIATNDPEKLKQQLGDKVNMGNVTMVKADYNDTWARDHGPITLVEENSNEGGILPFVAEPLKIVTPQVTPLICDFCFNGWGLKFAADKDNTVTRQLAGSGIFSKNAVYVNRLNFVLEGGSIESDGTGTLLTTECCLLSHNRNEQMSKEEIENYLKEALHIEHVLWLSHGELAGDDTEDEHYTSLHAMEMELKEMATTDGRKFKLLPLPLPDAVEMDGERLPATYANFLVMNNAVLVPTYSQPQNDQKAMQMIGKAFPDREIVGIDCIPLIRQHGSLHCVTMQFPEGTLK